MEAPAKIPGRGSGLEAMRMCSEASLTWLQKWTCLPQPKPGEAPKAADETTNAVSVPEVAATIRL